MCKYHSPTFEVKSAVRILFNLGTNPMKNQKNGSLSYLWWKARAERIDCTYVIKQLARGSQKFPVWVRLLHCIKGEVFH